MFKELRILGKSYRTEKLESYLDRIVVMMLRTLTFFSILSGIGGIIFKWVPIEFFVVIIGILSLFYIRHKKKTQVPLALLMIIAVIVGWMTVYISGYWYALSSVIYIGLIVMVFTSAYDERWILLTSMLSGVSYSVIAFWQDSQGHRPIIEGHMVDPLIYSVAIDAVLLFIGMILYVWRVVIGRALIAEEEALQIAKEAQQRAEAAESETRRIFEIFQDGIARLIHDAKNFEVGAGGAIEILLMGGLDETAIAELLNSAKSNSNMVQDLLLLCLNNIRGAMGNTGSSVVKIEELGIPDLLFHEKRTWAKYAEERGVVIETKCSVDVVRTDVTAIRRVIDNLVKNAIEHSRNRGVVEIAITEVENGWQLKVIDTGSGIDPKVRGKLFTKFSTGGKQGGLGLGLFNVEYLVDALQGTIEVESEIWKGTTFTCTFPKNS